MVCGSGMAGQSGFKAKVRESEKAMGITLTVVVPTVNFFLPHGKQDRDAQEEWAYALLEQLLFYRPHLYLVPDGAVEKPETRAEAKADLHATARHAPLLDITSVLPQSH